MFYQSYESLEYDKSHSPLPISLVEFSRLVYQSKGFGRPVLLEMDVLESNNILISNTPNFRYYYEKYNCTICLINYTRKYEKYDDIDLSVYHSIYACYEKDDFYYVKGVPHTYIDNIDIEKEGIFVDE